MTLYNFNKYIIIYMTSNTQTFILRDKKLISFPDIPNKEDVRVIVINNANLRSLPENIGTMFPMLRELDLDNNLLTTLPESIGNLRNLMVLDVDDNKLTTLPDSITKLYNLKTFSLNNNNIKSLPRDMTRLESLKFLFLNDNKNLTELPEMNYANLELIENENTGVKTYPGSFKSYKEYDPNLHYIMKAQDLPFLYPYKSANNTLDNNNIHNDNRSTVVANRILDDEEKNEAFVKGMNKLDNNSIRNIAEFWSKGGKSKKRYKKKKPSKHNSKLRKRTVKNKKRRYK